MSDEDKTPEHVSGRATESAEERRLKRQQDLMALRLRLATLVKVVFGVFAVILALGALLVVFGKSVSPENSVVKFIWNFADAIDGPFGRVDGVFNFDGKNGLKLNALVNWGIAAIVYLMIGNFLRKLLTRSK